MAGFRMVRVFSSNVNPSTERAYRVESVELLSERDAIQLMRDLGSPYSGVRDLPSPLRVSAKGSSGFRG